MYREIKKNPIEFLILFIVLILGSFLFLLFSYNDYLQRRIVYLAAAAYFLWSLIHHYRRGDLHLALVIEYLLMALLALLLLTSTLI